MVRPPVLRVFGSVVAAAYTAFAMLYVIAGWPGLSTTMLAMGPSIVLAMPWTLVLSVLESGRWVSMAIVLAGLLINTTLLWWWALRGMGRRAGPRSGTRPGAAGSKGRLR